MRGQGSVFAVGARTPIGLDAKQTALLLRSGIPAITAAPLAFTVGSCGLHARFPGGRWTRQACGVFPPAPEEYPGVRNLRLP